MAFLVVQESEDGDRIEHVAGTPLYEEKSEAETALQSLAHNGLHRLKVVSKASWDGLEDDSELDDELSDV